MRNRHTCHPRFGHPRFGRLRLGQRVVLLASASFLVATLASADHPSPRELHQTVREHVSDVFRHLERIPDRIERAHERHLEAFLGGREYYRPHRHHHSTYNFPVWIDNEVAYRPFAYCEGRLFGSGSVRPYLWTDWSRHDRGLWCEHCRGHFPHGHRHFQRDHRRPHYDHHRRDYRRHDDRDRHRRDRYYDKNRDDRHDRDRNRGRHDRRSRSHDRRGRGHGNH